MELGSSGDALQACRRRGIEVSSSGALEARCRRADVEVWSSEALGARCISFSDVGSVLTKWKFKKPKPAWPP